MRSRTTLRCKGVCTPGCGRMERGRMGERLRGLRWRSYYVYLWEESLHSTYISKDNLVHFGPVYGSAVPVPASAFHIRVVHHRPPLT